MSGCRVSGSPVSVLAARDTIGGMVTRERQLPLMGRPTQRERVLAQLKGGPTCGTEFLEMHIPRYAARILELRQAHTITNEPCWKHQHFSRQTIYRLRKEAGISCRRLAPPAGLMSNLNSAICGFCPGFMDPTGAARAFLGYLLGLTYLVAPI